jgi:hypothetical protein
VNRVCAAVAGNRTGNRVNGFGVKRPLRAVCERPGLCGACLSAVGMAPHHKLCHVLGGTFDLLCAETHSIILPHAVANNAPAAPDAIGRIARVLGTAHAALGLFQFARTGADREIVDQSNWKEWRTQVHGA